MQITPMRNIFKILLILITWFTLNGCEKKEVKKVNLFHPEEKKDVSSPSSSYVNSIKVGIAEVLSPKEGFIYYRELLDYMSTKLSLPVVMQYGHYEEINNLLESGKLDLAFICSGAYIEGNKKFGLQLLATPVINTKTVYHSYIIVSMGSPITNFDDLKGRSFAFTNQLSNSGYIFPVYLLSKKKTTPQQFFSKIIFTQSHDNSIIAVAEKLVEGAAVDSLVYDWLKQTNPYLTSRTKIILISPAFGIPPVVVPKNLDSQMKKNLENFFLNLEKEEKGRKILSELKIERFVKPDDRLYNSIRLMKAEIEKYSK